MLDQCRYSRDEKKAGGMEAAHMLSRMLEKIAMQLGVLLQHFAQVDDDARLVALRKGVGRKMRQFKTGRGARTEIIFRSLSLKASSSGLPLMFRMTRLAR